MLWWKRQPNVPSDLPDYGLFDDPPDEVVGHWGIMCGDRIVAHYADLQVMVQELEKLRARYPHAHFTWMQVQKPEACIFGIRPQPSGLR